MPGHVLCEALALGCGDYSIDKWTNTPVSIDIALAFHFEVGWCSLTPG